MRQFLRDDRRRCLWFAAIVVLFAVIASRTGTDADWDLRNYHAYNAHALLTGRFWSDIAAAQLQTYYSPVSDIVFGALRDWLNDRPVLLNVVLSLPYAVATFLAFQFTLRLIPRELPGRAPLALAATLFGAMGAASYPTLASAQSDMIPVSCILGGLLLFTEQPGPRRWAISKAGALFGIAVGLKLTAAPYCVAGVVALLLAPDQSASARCRTVLAFGAAGVAAAALVGGPWWLTMYIAYGNPILPSMNQLFHSPFVDPLSFTDERFQPRTWAQALAYPFYWAATPRSLVSELAVRDPRFAMAYVALTIVLLRSATSWLQCGRRLDRTATMLVAFFIASFVVWEALFSYLRYLAPLELLVGAVVLLAVQPLLAMPRLRVPAATVVLLLCAAGQVATIYPDWGRMPRPLPVAVRVPTLPSDSLVVLLDRSPMAYLAIYVRPSVRFVGANSNLIQPGRGARLAQQAEAAIRAHRGPLFGLEDAAAFPRAAGVTLSYYGLRRDHCTQVESNLDSNAIRLCRLLPREN